MKLNNLKFLSINIFFSVASLCLDTTNYNERDLVLYSLNQKINNGLSNIERYQKENDSINESKKYILDFACYRDSIFNNVEYSLDEHLKLYFKCNIIIENNNYYIKYFKENLNLIMNEYEILSGNKHFLDDRN